MRQLSATRRRSSRTSGEAKSGRSTGAPRTVGGWRGRFMLPPAPAVAPPSAPTASGRSPAWPAPGILRGGVARGEERVGYRLLALDVDGTLLDSRGVLRPRVRAAVRRAAAAGCLVALATGRRFSSAVEVAQQLGLDTPLILHNGAIVRQASTGVVLAETPLPLATARPVAREIVAAGSQVLAFLAGQREAVLAGPPELDGELAARYLA